MILLGDRTTVPCTGCNGIGRIRVNVTQDPSTGTWDYDETDCLACLGTGDLPAPANYQTFRLPGSDRVQWRCLSCGCCVTPQYHLPGSLDCERAAEERRVSRSDLEDPWSA